MAKTSEKLGKLAARVLDDGKATPEEVKRLAGSVLRQKEQRKTLKTALAFAKARRK